MQDAQQALPDLFARKALGHQNVDGHVDEACPDRSLGWVQIPAREAGPRGMDQRAGQVCATRGFFLREALGIAPLRGSLARPPVLAILVRLHAVKITTAARRARGAAPDAATKQYLSP